MIYVLIIRSELRHRQGTNQKNKVSPSVTYSHTLLCWYRRSGVIHKIYTGCREQQRQLNNTAVKMRRLSDENDAEKGKYELWVGNFTMNNYNSD